MRVLSIINQKGGVGKTTSVANIGAALAKDGCRVVLVDLDPQAHLSISFDRMPEPGDPSMYTLLTQGHSFADVIQPTSFEGLSIAPTNLDLTGVESELASEIGREGILRLALSELAKLPEAPDVVILDCPPSLGTLSLNALVASDSVIVPLQAEFFALQGMAQLLDVLERVKRRLNPSIELVGVLVGLFSGQRNLSREVVEELRHHFGDLVFDTHVRVNVRLAEAPSHGQTIFEYAPDSSAAEQFREIAADLKQRIGLGGSSTAKQSVSETPAQSEESTPATAPAAASTPEKELEAG
ncbi:MAG: ParA family protein [Planctomycetota bacterium]